MHNVDLRVTSFRQKVMAAVMGIIATTMVPLTAHAAELETVAKNSGLQVINLIIAFTLVVGAIVAVLGILMYTTNIQWLQNIGPKKLFIGLGGIIAVLCFSMLYKWVVTTMNSAGGSMGFQWPF